MNAARIIIALVSRYTGIALYVAGIGVLGVALTLPSTAEAAQASKPVAKKVTNKYVKKAGKPSLRRVAKTSTKKSKLAVIKSQKKQLARPTLRPATQNARIATPIVAVMRSASTLPGAVHQYPAVQTISLNSAPQMAAQYPDEANAPRKATTACLINGKLFLLAACNTESGEASGPDSHLGIDRETTAARPVGHHPLPASADPGLPAASADVTPPEPS